MPVETADVALGRSSSFEALPADFYQDSPITRILAYRGRKQDQEDKTKSYLVTQLDFWFDTGLTRENDKGETISLGVQYGFVTLSFHEASNFRKKLLNALGVTLSSDKPTLDYDFVGDYQGHSFLDLPLYPGYGSKADFAIEMTHFKIDGQELLGRRAGLDVGVNDKGYNTIDSFVKSRKPPLDLSELDTAKVYVKWQNQADAMSWGQAQEVDGKPLFANAEDLKNDYETVFKQYNDSLAEGQEPKREEFYQHWYKAVNAWKAGLSYDVDDGDTPF